jgi:hypothetical protein
MQSHTPPAPAASPPQMCSCAQPLRRVVAERKGAASSVCDRCGLPIPVRWRL